MAIAKGLGGGFPVGAFLATDEAAAGMTAGSHGSTFGGNPLAMAAGNAVLDVVLERGFPRLGAAQGAAAQAAAGRDHRPARRDLIEEVRGEGLLIGLKCKIPCARLIEALLGEHMLGIGAGENVVRLLPPLTVSEAEIAEACEKISAACAALER